jgi:hypothetical protein
LNTITNMKLIGNLHAIIYLSLVVSFFSCKHKSKPSHACFETFIGTHYFLPDLNDIGKINMYDWEECHHQFIKDLDNLRQIIQAQFIDGLPYLTPEEEISIIENIEEIYFAPISPAPKEINWIFNRLLTTNGIPNHLDSKVKILETDHINACQLLGQTYITRGLYEEASYEEIAYVLAHEIAHGLLHYEDMLRQISIEINNNTLGNGLKGILYYRLSNFFRFTSQATEMEADIAAALIMIKAELNPEAGISFFESLHLHEGTGLGIMERINEDLVSTHPRKSERIQCIKTILKKFQVKISKDDWYALSPKIGTILKSLNAYRFPHEFAPSVSFNIGQELEILGIWEDKVRNVKWVLFQHLDSLFWIQDDYILY